MIVFGPVYGQDRILSTKKNTNHSIRNIDLEPSQEIKPEIRIELNVNDLLKRNNSREVVKYE